MTFDYLKEIPEVVSILKSEKLDTYALQIQEAFDSACTGTEVLMGVRFYLLKLPFDKLSNSTKKRIENLIKEIELILS